MGRPRKKWNAEDKRKFRELCACFATRDEVCATMGVSGKTLNKLIDEAFRSEIAPDQEEPITFQDAFTAFSAGGRASLRRKQFELAMNGDKTMLMWLGKQYLGQREPEKIVNLQQDPACEAPKEETPLDAIQERRARRSSDAKFGMPTKD